MYNMSKHKHIIIFVYSLLVVVMGYATFYERLRGTADAHSAIYGSQWFTFLWAILAAMGTAYIVRIRMRRWHLLLLHLSFVVILCGAWLTRTFAFTGAMHLRLGETSNTFLVQSEDGGQHQLPFCVRLNAFKVINHEGTEAAADYHSYITLWTDNDTSKAIVAMNKIKTFRGVRLYQSTYDNDQKGCTLAVNSDPYGIPVTYMGYALLFVSLFWLLINPKGTFRQALRNPLINKALAVAAVSLSLTLFTAKLHRTAFLNLWPRSSEEFTLTITIVSAPYKPWPLISPRNCMVKPSIGAILPNKFCWGLCFGDENGATSQ